MTEWKVDKKFKKPKLVAWSGKDKMFQVGTNDRYGAMVQLVVNGKKCPVQPADAAAKFIQDWKIVG